MIGSLLGIIVSGLLTYFEVLFSIFDIRFFVVKGSDLFKRKDLPSCPAPSAAHVVKEILFVRMLIFVFSQWSLLLV